MLRCKAAAPVPDSSGEFAYVFQGLACHAMYDDSGNSCCLYKGNKLSCDYTGDSSDKDFICECLP